MKKHITLITLALLTSGQIIAAENKGGLFIEPMLTYERGEADVDLPSPFGSSKSKVNGLGVGARLGFHVLESVFLGIDGRYSLPHYQNDDTNIDSQATSYNYGPVVGVQMPTDIGLRVWGGYIMGGQMDVDKDQGIDLKFKEATGFRIGGGIKLASVSLNLEYQKINYNKTELQNPGLFSGSTNSVKQDNNSYILSVSFPISL